MKNILINLFSLSIFFISSCSQDPNKITIKGSITNPVSDELGFNFADTSYEAKVDADGITHDAFNDPELRYRRRYVDLLVNDYVKETFLKRSKV